MKWHRIAALMLKYWYLTKNNLPRIFDLFYWPLIGIIVFGFTTTYLVGQTHLPGLAVFLLGGLLLWLLFQRTSQDVAIFTLESFWQRDLANLFLTPVTTGELGVSLILLSAIRGVITIGVMFIFAYVVYSFAAFTSFASLLFAFPLFIFAWAVGILVGGMIFRYGMRIDVFAWGLTFLFQPLATIYYPLETMPQFMQVIAHGTPLVYIFEGYRLAYAGNFSIGYFLTAMLLALLYFALAFAYLAYGIRYARKHGRIAQN